MRPASVVEADVEDVLLRGVGDHAVSDGLLEVD